MYVQELDLLKSLHNIEGFYFFLKKNANGSFNYTSIYNRLSKFFHQKELK